MSSSVLNLVFICPSDLLLVLIYHLQLYFRCSYVILSSTSSIPMSSSALLPVFMCHLFSSSSGLHTSSSSSSSGIHISSSVRVLVLISHLQLKNLRSAAHDHDKFNCMLAALIFLYLQHQGMACRPRQGCGSTNIPYFSLNVTWSWQARSRATVW
jgi:hypothetical protein